MSKAISPLLSPSDRPVQAGAFLRAAFVGTALLPAIWAAWVLWIRPLANLPADRTALAARDFTALWGAGRLAIEGGTAALAAPALFTAHLRDWFGAGMPDQIWPYPPPTLLLAAPLSLLPLGWSFLLYTSTTLALLLLVLRRSGLPRPLCLVTILSPAVADNVLIGQNGALTAAFLAGGLLLVDARPLLAGALLGGLVIKPQLALLIPLCLLAGRRWRAGVAAAVVSTCIAALSVVWFGADAWGNYVQIARPAITAYLETPWDPGSAQRIFASAFIAARSLGAGLTTAYAIQAGATLLCAILAFDAWRRPDLEPRRRMALTVALTCAASPWVHTYDLSVLAVAIVVLLPASRPEQMPWLALAWFWPGCLTLLEPPTNLLILTSVGVSWVAWNACRPACRDVDDQPWRTVPCASSS